MMKDNLNKKKEENEAAISSKLMLITKQPAKPTKWLTSWSRTILWIKILSKFKYKKTTSKWWANWITKPENKSKAVTRKKN